jgi:transcriptional regulator with XRE-family HTH domain
MNLFEHVGQRIRDLRLNYGSGQGLSQEALARSLGVAANTVSRWETATYRPSLEDLEHLARFFGVSILEFFPPDEVAGNDQMAALLRTAQQLKPEDLEELRRYAEFRRARSLYAGQERPQAGRKRKAVP